MGYSRRSIKQAGLKTHVVVGKNRRNFNQFFTLALEIPDKTKSHPSKFHNVVLHNVLHPWNSKTKNQNPCFTQKFYLIMEFSLVFLINPWKFQMLFLLIPPEIACPQLPNLLFFPGIAQWMVPIASSYQAKTLRIIRYPYIQLNKLY